MDEAKLEFYWNDIPTEKENAITYKELCTLWGRTERDCRKILNRLSRMDNGDNYVLIRSGSGKGFYKTDDEETLRKFKSECLNKGKSIFAPVKKINRILSAETEQLNLVNNLRQYRELRNMTQSEVVKRMKSIDEAFDIPMLSKMENGACLPTFKQLRYLAEIFGCEPSAIVYEEVYY